MLPKPYLWRVDAESAFLDHNARNVAYIRQRRGQWMVVIRWQGRAFEGPCGSIRQGMRWVERWIAARDSLPGLGKVRWYDRR